MSANNTRSFRPLSIIHLLAVLATTGWWLTVLWQLSPVRDAWGAAAPATQASFTDALNASLARATRVVHAAGGDLLCLAVTMLALWFGTHAYVTRLRIWLEARSSGQALAIGSTDLRADALTANKEAPGVLR